MRVPLRFNPTRLHPMSSSTKLALVPLIAFLLSAFSVSFRVPPDACDLWLTPDGLGGFQPSCLGSCTPGGCSDPEEVAGGGVTRWWCPCDGTRGGEDVSCEAVLIYDSNYPDDPWVGRCYTRKCQIECEDFPELPPDMSFILCPCFDGS